MVHGEDVVHGRSLRSSFALAAFVATAAVSWSCYESTGDDVGADGDADADCDPILCEDDLGSQCCPTGSGESCVSTMQSFQHCGGCGEACDRSSASLCTGGECACGGSEACAGTPDDLCCPVEDGAECRNTLNHARSCGSCNNDCLEPFEAEQDSDRCIDGACSCGDSGATCDGDVLDTCCPDVDGDASCTNILRDYANCGGCALADRSDIPPHVRGDGIPDTHYACSAEISNLCLGVDGCVCGIPAPLFLDPLPCLGGRASTCCAPPHPDDADLAICADLDTSELHCGRCNHPCPLAQECMNGVCR